MTIEDLFYHIHHHAKSKIILKNLTAGLLQNVGPHGQPSFNPNTTVFQQITES